MDNEIIILLLEDNENDAKLVYYRIASSGLKFKWTHVSDLIEFIEILDKFKPDIILSDYNLTGFTGIDALEIVKQKCPLIPFIVVTGNLDEETAVETIKAGAWDYVLKDRLGRLELAIKNVLELKKEKEFKNQALENLKKSEERFALAIDGTMDGIWDLDFETGEFYYSPNYRLMLGYNENEFSNLPESWINLLHPEDKELTLMIWQQHLNGEIPQFYANFRMKCKNEKYKWILSRGNCQFNNLGKAIRILGSNKDISEDKIKEIELLKLSRVVQNSPVSIMLTNPHGIIEYVNPKFTEISGYSIEEVRGKPTSILKSGRHDTEFYKELWNMILQGKEWNGEFLNKKKNGDLFWESVSISGIRDSENKLISFIAIKEDITQKKQTEFELVKAKEKAEESNRLKTAFLHNISHEIRTPMNAILGFTSLLKKNNQNEENKNKFIQIINSSGLKLLEIMNNLIDISEVESNQLELNIERLNIKTFVEKLFNDYQTNKQSALKPDLVLRSAFSGAIHEYYIKTDVTRFRQIWDNLIANSFKCTDKGYIEIGCTVTHTKLGSEIEFYVKDTGIGIAEKDKEMVFDRFGQADNERFKDGLGLGLSLTKGLIELLDGKLRFESVEGVGSTFYFSFPLIINEMAMNES